MNLVKCSNGHFYDGSKFTECPRCAQTSVQETVPLEPARTDFIATSAAMGSRMPTPFTGTPSDDAVTVGIFQKMIGVEPVVGWLVCVKGEYFGESFKLRNGKNFIGRASDMDVILGMDKSVSRNRHACVIYEPKSRIFIAQPGESKELFYLNEDVVLNNMKMKANDVLQIGETRLMLVPCCNENFSWDDLVKESGKKE